MSSTTPNKKAIVDFLWDWTTDLGNWSKLLVSKIVQTETPLSQADRDEVFSYFLQSIKLQTGLPDLTIAKPTYTPTSDLIELDSLSAIKGVNSLAKDQTLNFSKNLTVIYGENGTGKTGYSRILKNLGFSYDKSNSIISNIYEAAEPQSATINYEINGVAKSFLWDGSNSDAELANISVFNNNCVKLSISNRDLIVSPMGFHLFQLVSDELNNLNELLKAKSDSHSTKLLWLENMTEESPQYNFISTLSATSTKQRLAELSEFTSTHQESLTAKEKELSNLSIALLQKEIQAMIYQTQELNNVIGKVEKAQKILNPTSWLRLIELNKEIAELENKTTTGIKEVADDRGIGFYDTAEFNSFIQAAESYIKIIDNLDYPEDGDVCVYCQQPLGPSAKELLQSYRKLLNDKTQDNLKVSRQEKIALIETITQVETNLTFHHSTFGTDENEVVIQPKQIVDYNKGLDELKTVFITDAYEEDSDFTFDYQVVLDFLIKKRTEITKTLTLKNETLSNIATKETTLKKEISELKDRKLLSTKKSEVELAIANHKIIKTLKSKAANFNTTAISRKTTSARDELVQQNFQDIFQEELRSLRKSNIKIDLNLKTSKGDSKVVQTMSSHALADILSEGEQKAIALAEFLTELQLDNTKAPVIFDDPVNSLDHKIIDQVVKRLIELSKTRQVVVFSHSILLLNSFIQQSKLDYQKQAVDFIFHSVKVNFGTTGILDEVEEINSYKYYKTKLNNILNTKSDGHDEATLAAEGYGHLRSAIEVSVENDLLKNTITRYGKGVSFPSFLRMNGSRIDESKSPLNDIYEKCCVSIAGHSSPEQIHSTPSISELKIDFKEFEDIRKEYNKQ